MRLDGHPTPSISMRVISKHSGFVSVADVSGRRGFSLIEVILALGIFLVTIMALVGLLGPTLKSVDDVEKIDEIVSVVNSVEAFLQSSPDIETRTSSPPVTKFDAIFGAVADNGYATIFVFRQYLDATSTEVRLVLGFDALDTTVNAAARLDASDFANAAGPVFRVVLTPSPVIPEEGDDLTDPEAAPIPYRSSARDGATGVYTLSVPLSQYAEGYFAMEARIFPEDPPAPGAEATFNNPPPTLAELAERTPLLTYNTAIIR